MWWVVGEEDGRRVGVWWERKLVDVTEEHGGGGWLIEGDAHRLHN